MSMLRIKRAAELMGVSDDTVRRWVSANVLPASTDDAGRIAVDSRDLAEFARQRARDARAGDDTGVARSARNNFAGLVTSVKSDPVMSQVRMQCGPFEVTSLMSTEAVEELGLCPGSVATAVVKATTVIVEKRDSE